MRQHKSERSKSASTIAWVLASCCVLVPAIIQSSSVNSSFPLSSFSHLVFLPPRLPPTWDVCFFVASRAVVPVRPHSRLVLPGLLSRCSPRVGVLLHSFHILLAPCPGHVCYTLSSSLSFAHRAVPHLSSLICPMTCRFALRGVQAGHGAAHPFIHSLPSLPGVLYSRKAALLLACSTWVESR